MRLIPLTAAALMLACAARTPEVKTTAAPASTPDSVLTFQGACDASGAVVLEGWLFAVGDDEDNVLRIYDGSVGGQPVGAVDVSPMLGLFGKKRPPELDVEAATGLGTAALWLTSHGRTSSGKVAPSRLQFFATSRVAQASELSLVGQPYTHLLDDLLADPRLTGFGLAEAASKPPKEEGGLNLEAMTATHDDSAVLLGFRSPIPQGRTLVVPLLNPMEVVEGRARARLGAPILLDLGGRGMRSLSTWRGEYLIVAGSPGSGGTSEVYAWDGAGTPRRLAVELADYNPEAFVTPEDQDTMLLLSDDGTRLIEGVECKRTKDVSKKSFRALRVPLPSLLTGK